MLAAGFILDLTVVVLAAVIGNVLVHRLGLPGLLGYLLAGAAIGPHALGLVHEVELVNLLAEIGVALLMFALGVHISLSQLRAVRKVAIYGGILQIALTAMLGMLVGRAIGFPPIAAIFLGAIVALSSTSVALRVLADRGELDTLQGRIITGILIVQDLSIVPIVVLLSAVAEARGGLQPPEVVGLRLALAVVKAALLLGTMYLLGTRIVPRILHIVAATQSRELFLLTIVGLVLGVSLAFGAFIAGVVLSESEFRSEILAEVDPLRDLFAMLFFVSVGMLVDFEFIAANLGSLAAVIAVIVFGKFAAGALAVALFGYSFRLVVLAALGLAQIGEFSFVLASLGVAQGIITQHFYSLTVSAALVTILLSPLVMQVGPGLVTALQRVPFLHRITQEPALVYPGTAPAPLTGHVVIAGYGEVGQTLAQVLEARHFRYLVIEYDPNLVERLRSLGVPAIYGDASNPRVLEQANLGRARVFVVTLPDTLEAQRTIRLALRINSRLDVIARASTHADLLLLRDSGAREIVEPKFEAGLEIVRHTLHRFGISSTEIAYQVSRLREQHYESPVEGEVL